MDTATYGGLALGYAGTIYKGQGKTLDQAYLLHTGHWRDQASYVAMTRARAATYIFVSREGVRDLKDLAQQMSRASGYGASLRYATAANDLKAGGFSEARTVHSLLWHADQYAENVRSIHRI